MKKFVLLICFLCVGCNNFTGISNDEIISAKVKCEKANMDYEIIKSAAIQGLIVNVVCKKK